MPVAGLSGAGGGPFAGTFGSSIKSFVYTPTILSPTGDLVLNPVTLTASDFASEGLVKVHVSSDWQIATDSNFSNVVKSTTNDTTNKTSWSPSGDLDLGTTYYARVRYTGGPKEAISEWSATHTFKMMAVPVVSWTTDTPSSWNPTAGQSRTFNATATDTANPGGGHNTYTYQWYRNGGAVSGYTGQSFNFYNPCYYSDNGNNIYCRVTITNAAGSTSANSTTCNISVNRNVSCEEIHTFNDIRFAGSGGKPNNGEWGGWEMPTSVDGKSLNEVCAVNWYIGTFRARARPGRCPNGYHLTLRFDIGRCGSWERQETQSGNDYTYWGLDSGWVNVPNCSRTTFKIFIVAGSSSTYCDGTPGPETDIQAEMGDDARGQVAVKTRQYQYETRP